MKYLRLFYIFALLVPINGCATEMDPSITRVGIYDSRAVAVAFVGSDVYEKTAGLELKSWQAEHEQAQAANDEQRMRELQAQAEALQAKFHQQAFGTAPVDDILEHISDKIPAIAQRIDVQVLVSKWDSKTLKRYRGAEQIDVTAELIEAFGPTNEQRESALAIQKVKPVKMK